MFKIPKVIKALKSTNEKIVKQITVDTPQLKSPNHTYIKTLFTGLNRADYLQSLGRYPPPPGVTDILGLECLGELLEDIELVNGQKLVKGQKAMCILSGGGWAEYVPVLKSHLLPIPKGFTLQQAAAIPEA